MPHFADQLTAAIRRCRNPVVVGLDPRWEQLPAGLKSGIDPVNHAAQAEAYARFCREIVDVVAPLVPAVKPQAAFFEQLGPAGMTALGEVVRYARDRNLLVIMDGKRNDIGSTATAYADGYLGPESAWGADALTINPYLGDDSLSPFVQMAQQRGAGLFVLVKTSNPGGGQFQDLKFKGQTLYARVAEHVEKLSQQTLGQCGYGIVGAVVGATYAQQLVELRQAMPHTIFLVPGYGSQGGTAKDTIAAFDEHGLGAVINNSRGIIFAHERKEYATRFGEGRWQESVEAATRDMIDQLRTETTVALL